MFLACPYNYHLTFWVFLRIFLRKIVKSKVLTAQGNQLLECLFQKCAKFAQNPYILEAAPRPHQKCPPLYMGTASAATFPLPFELFTVVHLFVC